MKKEQKKFLELLRITLVFSLFLIVLTGLIYPLFITGIAQVIVPHQANGSLIVRQGSIYGSELIGQMFTQDKFFQGRPSAIGYSTLPSGASNAGPLNPDLKAAVAQRRADLANRYQSTNLPSDLLYASASGLDPDISLAAAQLQINRVVTARGFKEEQKKILSERITTMALVNPLFPTLPRVNIMKLNLMLETDTQFSGR